MRNKLKIIKKKRKKKTRRVREGGKKERKGEQREWRGCIRILAGDVESKHIVGMLSSIVI